MGLPSELPLLFDAGILPERGDTFSSRANECKKAGADAVCVPAADTESVFFPEAASNEECTARTAARVAAARAAGASATGCALGPTGLLVPPSGESDFEDICAVRRGQVSAVCEANADFLLLDRQTSLADMRAAILAARGTNLPVLACCDLRDAADRDAQSDFLPALVTLQAMGAAAVGFRGIPGADLLETVREAFPCASVPLLLIADAAPDMTPAQYAEAARPFLDAGVRLVGCGQGATPLHLRALCDQVKKYGPPEIPEGRGGNIAATEHEVFFLGEDIEFSSPITCSTSLSDKLIALEDERISAALVKVESVDDAVFLGKHGSVARLPIAVLADSATVLEAALRYFQGRLLVDSRSPVEREVLEPLASKYGAIIY